MNLDIIFVTYNSQKWIDNCFKSIHESEYDLKQLNLIIVDNNSQDDTVKKLNHIKEQTGNDYGDFKIIESKENLGFGKGNNLGFEGGTSPYVLFLNIDTEVENNTFSELEKEIISSNEKIGAWELRQFPYEHPKFYNPVTEYTSWSSGAALVVRRDLFKKIGGFDKNIFMYAEDVDLSWRIRCEEYYLKYCPKAVVNHYSYEGANQVKPTQYYNSIINNLLLRYKFGNLKDIITGYAMFLTIILGAVPFKDAKKELWKRFIKHFKQAIPFLKWKLNNKEKFKNFKPNFYGWDYEIIREGAFYYNELPIDQPLVSIIVRTCGRPSVLRETLISLKNQTYKNLEVVIIEDGENISEEMISTEFSDLNILYYATGKKVGRCRVGNIGMDKANGKYLNFLDDDDVFFADHVEVLVKILELNQTYRAAYAMAFETPIIIESKEPYIYKEMYHNLIHRQAFNRTMLFHHNYIPIQTIMFEKDLFLENGGFDENLDVLEDWDLWVRYALSNKFYFINKVTSMYRVPFNKVENEERHNQLHNALESVRAKHHQYSSTVTVGDTARETQEILDYYTIKLSADFINQLESKKPIYAKMLIKFKNFLSKFIK